MGDIRPFNQPDADPFAGHVASNSIGFQPLLEMFIGDVRPDAMHHAGCTALPTFEFAGEKQK